MSGFVWIGSVATGGDGTPGSGLIATKSESNDGAPADDPPGVANAAGLITDDADDGVWNPGVADGVPPLPKPFPTRP